ncbi:hypothetical protein FISHEDRAFT_65629 [Fistulina hepatica ATCC 64428]|uniref:Malic enzyme n=1 Tax=Fistulina hepatica ATCC 64428 TaxID=1128425 RepID=A0A0D7ADI6_9AGAR|nr:hypothetical protein FISHEDRAFT_65629 [Fistulina hepatica ATCC 64428]
MYRGMIREAGYGRIDNWGNIPKNLFSPPQLDLDLVVTGGSRILGLGDLGVNGMPIAVGKLSLYVAGAGIDPASTLPICLYFGTNTHKLLDNPLYLGARRKRPTTEEMDEFMDEIMHEMATHFLSSFPRSMYAFYIFSLQRFSDFSTDSAFHDLARYRNRYATFNDDIQGTGAVVLSGFLNAAKLSATVSGRPLDDQRVGVVMQSTSFFRLQGMSEEEARNRGLMYDHKKYFSCRDNTGPPTNDLLEIVEYVKPTAPLGLSIIAYAFACVRSFSRYRRTGLFERSFEDAVANTNSSVLFASGSPFDEIVRKGKTLYPGQGNNIYIFSGLGLGSILSEASAITDAMVESASYGLSIPREISVFIAAQVITAAQREGVAHNEKLRGKSLSELVDYAKEKMWYPQKRILRWTNHTGNVKERRDDGCSIEVLASGGQECHGNVVYANFVVLFLR